MSKYIFVTLGSTGVISMHYQMPVFGFVFVGLYLLLLVALHLRLELCKSRLTAGDRKALRYLLFWHVTHSREELLALSYLSICLSALPSVRI
jgi:hypothetical protein